LTSLYTVQYCTVVFSIYVLKKCCFSFTLISLFICVNYAKSFWYVFRNEITTGMQRMAMSTLLLCTTTCRCQMMEKSHSVEALTSSHFPTKSLKSKPFATFVLPFCSNVFPFVTEALMFSLLPMRIYCNVLPFCHWGSNVLSFTNEDLL
jgi:hypothetical protein